MTIYETKSAAWRTERARKAALAMHAKHDSRETSAPGRAAFLNRFEREADPEGLLSEAERLRRAKHLRIAHMQRLALKSAQVRRARKAARA